MCHSSFFLKSTKKKRPVRIVNAVGKETTQMENTSSLVSFETGRCWFAQLRTMETSSCPGKTDQQLVFMEKLHPKSQTSDVEQDQRLSSAPGGGSGGSSHIWTGESELEIFGCCRRTFFLLQSGRRRRVCRCQRRKVELPPKIRLHVCKRRFGWC